MKCIEINRTRYTLNINSIPSDEFKLSNKMRENCENAGLEKIENLKIFIRIYLC